MYKKFLVVLLPIVAISFLSAAFLYKQGFFKSKEAILASCSAYINRGGHSRGLPYHYHMDVHITQNGRQITIPANLGVSGFCMHPIHTHDTSGHIHIDYPKLVTFTLGDLYDVMGVVFTDKQIGSLKTVDGYKIQVFVDDKQISNHYRDIVLKNGEQIKIIITSL